VTTPAWQSARTYFCPTQVDARAPVSTLILFGVSRWAVLPAGSLFRAGAGRSGAAGASFQRGTRQQPAQRAEQFEKAGLISDSGAFWCSRVCWRRRRHQAGSYSVGASITPHRLLDKIVSGEFAQSELRFIEVGPSGKSVVCSITSCVKHDSAGLSDAQIRNASESRKNPEGCSSRILLLRAGTSDLTISGRLT